MTKLELGGALIGVMVVVFTLGFFANDKISNSSQPAQTFSILKSSVNRTQQTTTTTPRVTTPTTSPATPATGLWRKFKDTTNQSYTEIPQSSVQSILRFCEELKSTMGQVGVAKLAFQATDGKYYCLNSNGTAGGLCGNGTASGCQSSGCCGSCLGGVLPPGVTDLTQLPGLFFVPNRIIEAIQSRTR